jgi:4-hydroxy-3-polyprenylbenzoate decarboxylase
MRQWPRSRFDDLHQFIAHLERTGQLRRILVEVDPVLEVTEIVQRVVKEQGPALLFERVRGAAFPLVINLFGSPRRIEEALGDHPEAIGQAVIEAIEGLNPPRPIHLWQHRHLFVRALAMRPRLVQRAPVQEVSEEPDLDRLPILQCWPGDGGRFITFGMVLTEHPVRRRRNLGLYRLHVYDRRTTGMHWQSMKGGRGHYFVAEQQGQPLDVAVVLGGDPVLMLASILPLPEDFDEIAFAGFLRGRRPLLVKARTSALQVPAHAEFILEGQVPPFERRREGPFGDHFGHYSEAADFPVLHLNRVTRRRQAIYPASVVGKPPQEDKYLGQAAGLLLGPFVKLIAPNVVDLWAYDEAGFHNLLAVAVRERHPKEVLKTAFGLLGVGQLALTKVMVLVREDVNCRRFDHLLRELWWRFDPEERMLLLPTAPLDTLDFTSFTMHVGSKLILDATGDLITRSEPPSSVMDPRRFDPRIVGYRLLEGGWLVVAVEREARHVLSDLIRWTDLGPVKWIVAVSPDVRLADDESLLWGIFTRFDPARDVICEEMRFVGARPSYRGRLAIDATWKQGYPQPLEMDPDIQRRVDRRWGDYFGR